MVVKISHKVITNFIFAIATKRAIETKMSFTISLKMKNIASVKQREKGAVEKESADEIIAQKLFNFCFSNTAKQY